MISMFYNKKDCCGCTACKSRCPKQAIIMKPDEEGFLYPEIDRKLCIDCGLCIKVCAFQNGYDTLQNFEIPYVYAARHIDEKVRMSSTSGGAFTAISDYILHNDGLVYGVAFDENMNVVHQRADKIEDREKFKGSKYVQSDLKNTFFEIKDFLLNGKLVLFTGTPCQVAGLKSYLVGVKTDMLILCDIICHGIPSPLMWREHILYLEKKQGCKIVEYYCRSKVNGWHGHNELSIYQNGKKDYESSISQNHQKLFYLNTIQRPSCHNCKYTNLQRPSDITIADFWGIENCMPYFDDNKGASLLLINTPKGRELFEHIKENLKYEESNTKDCLQPQLQYPSKASPKREQFWNDYRFLGYKYVIKKYAGYGVKSRIKQYIVKILIKTRLLEVAKKIVVYFRSRNKCI